MLRLFPKLTWYARTSDPTWRYNCHAWGADDPTVWWEPGPPDSHPQWPWMRLFWPLPIGPDSRTLAAFQAAHATVDFEVCDDGDLVDGYEKIAHYEKAGHVSHTARQLPWGTWTSKLGADMDIEHLTPEELEGPFYGRVAGYMVRPRRAIHVGAQSEHPAFRSTS